MKRFVLFTCLLVIFQLAAAGKIELQKHSDSKLEKIKVHTLEKVFSGAGKREISRKSKNFEKLLVLLIEFQADTTAATTGNGQFIQTPAGYEPSLGKPPHDFQFFSDQLTALRYYYQAASMGHFDLNYDIFPISKKGRFEAYTLPHELSYYSPGMGNQELAISRFEEYFADCFHIADETSPEIDFSQYDHFMLIHAGSDWQHDVLGNSPNDMPSFYIQMGDGKEVYVDGGTVMIDQACNVPETITQDIEEYSSNSIPVVYNYGVINAVMAHEFGHSLGFVDLYNTSNFYPAVGYWDIMDSGGAGLSGIAQDLNGDGQADKLFYIEGVLPALPSIWSRLLVWENELKQDRWFKNISSLNFDEAITLEPAGKKPSGNSDNPYFIKIPLENEEYLLLENRQVDPDGDGGTSVVTTHDDRVVLYPSSFDDPYDLPTYEYDYLLPGWQKRNGDAVGGGIIVWHIDNKILYENNNFVNNSVNTSYSNRAVKIIEADNLPDIGNPYSLYWRGTAYEPYHKYLPELDADGYFLDWDIDYQAGHTVATFNDELSATSKPSLELNCGQNSLYRIYDIGNSTLQAGQFRTINFKIGTQYFDFTQKISDYDSLKAIGPIGKIEGFPTFPVIDNEKIELISIINNSIQNHLGFELPFSSPLSLPISYGNKEVNNEFYLTSNEKLTVLSHENTYQEEYPDSITSAPMYIKEYEKIAIPTESILYIGNSELNIPAAKLTYNNEHLVCVSKAEIKFIDLDTEQIVKELKLPNTTKKYEPISYIDTLHTENSAIFIQDENANVYKITANGYEKIFTATTWGKQASQLSLSNLTNNSQIYLGFGIGNRAFAITPDGSLLEGFPAYLENAIIATESYPEIIKNNNSNIILFATENNGVIALDSSGKIHPEMSFGNSNYAKNHIFYWDKPNKYFYYFHQDSDNTLYVSFKEFVAEDPVIWEGFRNNIYGSFQGAINIPIIEEKEMKAYAFPNPAKNGEFRLKVQNAKADIDIKIFDIAGNKIYSENIEKTPGNIRDIRFSTKKLSSGVYFAVIKSRGETKKVPIAIIK